MRSISHVFITVTVNIALPHAERFCVVGLIEISRTGKYGTRFTVETTDACDA